MKSTQAIFWWLLCLLSILAFWLLGMVGEELLNLSARHDVGKDAEHLPAITQFFFSTFPLNSGLFRLSFTPFMLLMLGAAALRGRLVEPSLSWVFFAIVWVLALVYFLLFAFALLLPFHILLGVMHDSPVPTIVWTINTVIAIMLVAGWTMMKRKKKEAEPSDGAYQN